MQGMQVDLNILIQLAVLLVGIVGIYYALKGKVDIILVRLTNLENSSKSIQTMLTSAAVLNQRIENLEEDVRDLRRGRGFIREEINGQYTKDNKIT
jgi:hypothetical protein